MRTQDEIEAERREGESSLGEWTLARPNRFSQWRGGADVLALGILSCTCLLPVGWLAVIRAVRCADQYREAGLRTPRKAVVGGALGVLGTLAQVAVVARLTLGS